MIYLNEIEAQNIELNALIDKVRDNEIINLIEVIRIEDKIKAGNGLTLLELAYWDTFLIKYAS